MRINIYQRLTSGGHASEHLKAIADGLKRHGHHPRMLQVGRPEPCDLAVCWGVRKKPEMASGRRALVLERGYVGDRMNVWTSLGFDGLNGLADFRNVGMGPERWEKHLAQHMEGWFDGGGDYVLVMGQVAGDAALYGLDIDRWLVSTVRTLQGHGLAVKVRPHPLSRKTSKVLALPQADGDLLEVIGRASWVVTYSSNSAVDAVLAGVPTVAMHRGSMAWAVTGRDPWRQPPTPDRSVWAAEIAWAQWTLEEIRRGDAWDHLRAGLPV